MKVIAVLVLLHFVGVVAEDVFGDPRFLKLRALFDLNREQNIPTLFSTMQLLLASLLLAIVFSIARRESNPDRFYWAGLSLIFACLGADEFCEWHERLIEPMRRVFHPTGALSFAWVIPYSALLLLFGLGYARFWWRLPPPTRQRFAVAGVIYVGGGIVLEMVGAEIFTLAGWQNLPYDMETMVEEGMEMSGVALFICAILGHLRDRVGAIRIELRDDRNGADHPEGHAVLEEPPDYHCPADSPDIAA